MSALLAVACEDCGADTGSTHALRRFCDGCLRVHDRERVRSWKRANKDAVARHQRERRARRRAERAA